MIAAKKLPKLHSPKTSLKVIFADKTQRGRSKCRRSFILVLVAAPILARHRGNTNVQGFIKGAYAAAIGTTDVYSGYLPPYARALCARVRR